MGMSLGDVFELSAKRKLVRLSVSVCGLASHRWFPVAPLNLTRKLDPPTCDDIALDCPEVFVAEVLVVVFGSVGECPGERVETGDMLPFDGSSARVSNLATRVGVD